MTPRDTAGKYCSKCLRTLPLAAFCKASRTKDGLHAWCRHCNKTYQTQLRSSKPRPIKERRVPPPIERTKACTQCGLVKPLEQFHKDKRKRSGYGADCLVCHNEQSLADYYDRPEKRAAWYAANRDNLLENSRMLYAKRPEFFAAKNKRYRDTHKDTIAAQKHEAYVADKPAVLLRVKAYRKTSTGTRCSKSVFCTTPQCRGHLNCRGCGVGV